MYETKPSLTIRVISFTHRGSQFITDRYYLNIGLFNLTINRLIPFSGELKSISMSRVCVHVHIFMFHRSFKLVERGEYLKYEMNTILSNIMWTYGFSCTHTTSCRWVVNVTAAHVMSIMGTVDNMKALLRRREGTRTVWIDITHWSTWRL